MESYAFLVAQRDYLKKFQLSSYPVEIEDNSKEKETTLCISVIFNNEKFTLYRPFSTIPNFWANAEKIESARQVILFNNKNQISFLEAVGKMMLEEFCNTQVKCASLKKYVVTYWVGINKYLVHLKPDKPFIIQDYENLTAARALLLGYNIKEIKGSHFEVTSASGKVQAASLNNCTCKEFADFSDCIHSKFAKAIARNRPLLGYLLR